MALATVAVLLCLCAVVWSQATPSRIAVTGNLSGISTTGSDVLQARFTLVNCGAANPVVPGVTLPVAKGTVLTADSSGNIAGTLWGNDVIVCNGLNSTLYQVTFLRNSVPTGVASFYRVVTPPSGPATFNLTSATPTTVLPPTGNLANGFTCPGGAPVIGVLVNLTPVCGSPSPTSTPLSDTSLNAYTSAVVGLPTVSQAVTQPNGTTLAVNQLNGVANVNPLSPLDLVTQVNALFAACNYLCQVHIPAGNYTVATGTILMNHATQSLTGDGKGSVRITYAGTNFLDWRFGPGTYDFNTTGEVSGFTVTCTNLAVVCVSGGSSIGPTWKHLNIYGPGGITNAGPVGTSQGMMFQNGFGWMERWAIVDVNLGGFQTNIHFKAPTGSGTNSFGYGTLDVHTNQGPGTYGIAIDSGVAVYNQLGWKHQVNSGGATTYADEYLHVAGGLSAMGFQMTGENAGSPITGMHTLCGGLITVSGDYNLFGGAPVADCPTTNGYPSIWIRPTAGLLSVNGGQAGAGTIPNWLGTGLTAGFFLAEPLDISNPFVTAEMGYVQLPDGTSAPIAVYDPATSFCAGTRPKYGLIANVTPKFCVDGPGNITTPGNITSGTGGLVGNYAAVPYVRSDNFKILLNTAAGTTLLNGVDFYGVTKFYFNAGGGSWQQGSNSSLSYTNNNATFTVDANGNTNAASYSAGGTAGFTGKCASGTTPTFKNGIVTGCS